MVTVRGLTVSFPSGAGRKRLTAVEDVSFDLLRCCRTGIIGESGSGKSVTCMSLTGLVNHIGGRIDSGTVNAFGVDIISSSEKKLEDVRKRNTAYVFQEPLRALTPHLTVAQHFSLRFSSLGLRGRKQIRDETSRILKEVHLEPDRRVLHSYPRELSGGMAQRVMIGLALAGEPELLIADEPATALDAATRMRVMETLRETSEARNMGLLLVSHDVGLTAALTDYLLVMKDGRVVEQGRTREVITSACHRYTRKLISSVPSLFRPAESVKQQFIGDAALELKNVTVRYPNGIEGLRNVSLSLRAGGITAIAGESGSGKSTLVKACLGLVDVSQGSILVDGVDTAEMNALQLQEARRRMQIVFQNPSGSFNPDLLMEVNLQEPLRMLTSLSRKQRIAVIRGILDRVGLGTSVLSRRSHQFSGGQKQRMSITRSLTVSPMLLFADEPVSALDVSIQAEVVKLFKELQLSMGFQLVFVTHDLAVASQLADTLVVMHRGEVVEQGSTREVIGSPVHGYTKKLLEASAWGDIQGGGGLTV